MSVPGATSGTPALSVVMPCYRLGDRAGRNALEVAAFLEGAGIDAEVVPVDDGSGDSTAPSLEAAAAGNPRVHPVILKENSGKGQALREGAAAAKAPLVMLLDGDLDISPSFIPRFLDTMRKTGADIVIGSKRHPESIVDYPWHRRLASRIYFALVRVLVGVKATDTQTGMKLFRAEVLREAMSRMLVKTFAFDLELLAIANERGAKIAEAPVELRFQGHFGCLSPRTVREMLHDTLAVFYRLRVLGYYRKCEVPPPQAEPPLVSIVIACPSSSPNLLQALECISRQTHPFFETIVLPDAETTPPESLTAAAQAARARWIPTGKVRPAEKRNMGIAAANGSVVAFLDDDAYPATDWLKRAVAYFSIPSVGAVGGPGVTPSDDSFLARAGGRVYANPLVSGNYRYRYVAGLVRKDVDDFPSCNLFVRADLLREIGGYRTDFWPGEDTLLCEDIVYRGSKRIVYDPWTIVYHHRRALFAPHLRQLTRYALHRGYFAKRHPLTSLKLSYFVPSLLLGYSVALCAAMPFVPVPARWMLAAPMAAYLALAAILSFSPNPAMWLLTTLGVVSSHFGYGARFLQGLFARRMPCEFIGSDHAGGKNKRKQA